MIAVSERDSQYSSQQGPNGPTSESFDFTMGISESTSEESNLAHFGTGQTASDENANYVGSPASVGRGVSSQYEHVSPTDQDLVDCEFRSFQRLPFAPRVRMTFMIDEYIRGLSVSRE